jgi:hypothetical protein
VWLWWGDRSADIEIKEKWPGAPRLMGFTREQNSWGGTNAQLVHDANALMGVPSRYELTSADNSLGGSASAVAGSQEVAFSPPHLKCEGANASQF